MKQKIYIHNLKQISHLTSKRYHFKEKIATANENCLPSFFGDVIKSNLSMRQVALIRRLSGLGSHRSGCKKANNFLTSKMVVNVVVVVINCNVFSASRTIS